MRQVTISGTDYPIHASPLAIPLYKQEFGADLLPDSYHIELANAGMYEEADYVVVLQVLWALIATAHSGRYTCFDAWVASLPPECDYASEATIAAACAECRRGFFVTPDSTKRGSGQQFSDPEIGVLVTARRVGLTFEELNVLTLDSFVTFIDLWTGDDPSGTRPATQADIKALLG
jgi:hypothetical protein